MANAERTIRQGKLKVTIQGPAAAVEAAALEAYFDVDSPEGACAIVEALGGSERADANAGDSYVSFNDDPNGDGSRDRAKVRAEVFGPVKQHGIKPGPRQVFARWQDEID